MFLFWDSKFHFWSKSCRKGNLRPAWIPNQLPTKSFESQIIWKPIESQSNWNPNHLNPNSLDTQKITWISNQLTSKSLEFQIDWHANHLNLKSTDNQIIGIANQLTTAFESSIHWQHKFIWISRPLTTKSLESQINWQPNHLKPKSIDNQNHLTRKSDDNQTT